jgi:hypothetical protein
MTEAKKSIGVYVGASKATTDETNAFMNLMHANPDYDVTVVKPEDADTAGPFDFVTGKVPEGNDTPLWEGPTEPETVEEADDEDDEDEDA